VPKYEYCCNRCEKFYMIERSINEDDPGYKCTLCQENLIRVYSSVGVIFNGSGFYKTDNKK
jgi:putative FmdB family regulatory protein